MVTMRRYGLHRFDNTSRYSSRNRGNFVKGCLVLALLLAVGVGIYQWSYGTQRWVTITVDSKERIVETTGSGDSLHVSSRYLVFADDGEVYQCSDSLLNGKFDSSSVYGRLKQGETFRVLVTGWRLPIFSTYPNILKVERQ